MADNSCPDILVPLRNLLNSVQCLRDHVKDGESKASTGDFNLQNFWDTMSQAVKATSQEATKLSLSFSKPPLPSPQGCESLAESIQKSVLALTTVYYRLPKNQGMTLRRVVRDATAEVLDGLVLLIDVILSSPLQSLSQEQLTSTGSLWSSCDRFCHLPRDNQAAVLEVLLSCTAVVKDAIEEIEQVQVHAQALADTRLLHSHAHTSEPHTPFPLLSPLRSRAQAEVQDPFSDVLEEEDMLSRGNQDTYWSDLDRQLMGPCRGLMKASAACLKKLSSAVKINGNVDSAECIAQLDDLADIAKEISPSVDDLALSLYPPMDYSAVELNACRLASVLKKALEICRTSHVCLEAELSWVQFLEGAVEHNLQKAKTLAQAND